MCIIASIIYLISLCVALYLTWIGAYAEAVVQLGWTIIIQNVLFHWDRE